MGWREKSIVGLAILLGFSGCTKQNEPHHAVGYLEADWSYVAPLEAGIVEVVLVKEGERVDLGTRLLVLDMAVQEATLKEAEQALRAAKANARNIDTGARPPEIDALKAALEQAEAELERATSERARIMPLVRDGVEAPIVGDNLEARYKAAVAAVEQAKAQIEKAQLAGRPAQQEAAAANIGAAEARLEGADYRLARRTLTAPVTGRVEEVLYEPGELIPAGRPALAISPDDGIKVRFFVKEARLPDLSVGKKVRVHLDGRETPIEGTISYIATTAEYTPPVIFSNKTREKQVFLVEATLPPDQGAHPGLPAEVDW